MADDLLLGIDVGTTNIKVIVFTTSGAPAASASVATPTERPQPGWAEHDPHILWESVVAAIRRALAAIDDPRRVRGLAVASVGEAGVLLDARGEPLTPIIAWYDRRTATYARRWNAHDDPLETFRLTGMLPVPIYGVSSCNGCAIMSRTGMPPQQPGCTSPIILRFDCVARAQPITHWRRVACSSICGRAAGRMR